MILDMIDSYLESDPHHEHMQKCVNPASLNSFLCPALLALTQHSSSHTLLSTMSGTNLQETHRCDPAGSGLLIIGAEQL